MADPRPLFPHRRLIAAVMVGVLAVTFDQDLSLADVEVQPCPGCDWSEEVYSDVDAEISALIAELKREGASELLRGRTFARTLQ